MSTLIIILFSRNMPADMRLLFILLLIQPVFQTAMINGVERLLDHVTHLLRLLVFRKRMLLGFVLLSLLTLMPVSAFFGKRDFSMSLL